MTFVQSQSRRVSCVTFLSGSGISNITVIGDPMTVALQDAALSVDLSDPTFAVALANTDIFVALSNPSISAIISPAVLTVELVDTQLEVDLG